MEIRDELFNKMFNFIGSRPWLESNPLMVEIIQELEAKKDDNKIDDDDIVSTDICK